MFTPDDVNLNDCGNEIKFMTATECVYNNVYLFFILFKLKILFMSDLHGKYDLMCM